MTILQHIIFPDPIICTEHDLYYHMRGVGGYSSSDNSLHLNKGAVVKLDSYFNLFSVGKWASAGGFTTLYFSGEAKGCFELRLSHAIPDKSWEMLYCDVHMFEERSSFQADLSHFVHNATQGVIIAEIRALEDGVVFYRGCYETDEIPDAWPKLAISITTFKREKQVEQTVSRLENFFSESELGDHIHTLVVDNGQSTEIQSSDHVTLVRNRNLGGAGGFARGMMEARERGFSHCLFMDDDASFHMENIYRTFMFLALAKNSRAAVAGAMINNTHKWRLWESGAIFHRTCRPQFIGRDLRKREAVFEVEFESAYNNPVGFYGGWWFFAFPLAHAEYFPFPFFVRGDDVNFSIANDFRIFTLNGVTSFQDDFTEKESPLTLYLDLRGHLLHHMLFDRMELGRLDTIGIAWLFFSRSLKRFHYETAEAQLLSLQDMMRGPSFFTDNIDMAERRATVKDLTKNEYWKPLHEVQVFQRRLIPVRNRYARWLFSLTFNGQLLPFSQRWMNHTVVPIHDRGLIWPSLGATRVTYINSSRDKGYTVQQSKRRFFGLLGRFLVTSARFVWNYKALRDEYRRAYPEMTSERYWRDMTR